MNNIDLNLDNYDYQDLLNIFKISNTAAKENKERLERKMLAVREKFREEDHIYMFYFKAYKIILCIFHLFKTNTIVSLENNNQIEFYIEQITDIEAYEAYETANLATLIRIHRDPGIPLASNDVLPAERIFTQPFKERQERVQKSVVNILQDAGPASVPNTYNNELAPGEINSIKRLIQTQNLNLNSCFRTNYFASSPCDFQYIIPTEIKNVVSIRLASIELPNAWYLYSSLRKNNTMEILFKTLGVITNTYTITIADGNYDTITLANYLNTKYFYTSTNTNELQYIEFKVDLASHKTVIKLIPTHPANMTFSLKFVDVDLNSNIMGTLGWSLGFRLANYLNVSDTLISEGLYDGGSDRHIYFSLNDYQYNSNILNIIGFDKAIMDENILAKIPMTNGKLSLILGDSNTLSKVRKYNGPVNIRNLHIRILDMFGAVVDLNHMDFSFTLEIEVLYECFNFKNILA